MTEADDPIWHGLHVTTLDYTADVAQQIPGLPPQLPHLNCEGCELDSLTPLFRFRDLRVLNISGTQITSLDGIAHFAQLELLYADFCSIAELAPLAALSKLRALDLSCSFVDFHDMTPLGQLSSLERLYLAQTSTDSIGCLLALPRLKLLSLANTLVSQAEIAAFRAQRPDVELWT